jgi:Domain of unknown function (DUF1707)/Cell wall-active antibiotics response 4TMS YvqF
MSPSEHQPILSLTDERERIIRELSLHFANDNLSLDELELRMEQAYKAATVADLRTLTADLPQASPPDGLPAASPTAGRGGGAIAPRDTYVVERDKLVSVMSETKRHGAWAVPQRLNVYALMSDTEIDLTQATLPPGVVDIHVRSLFASVKLLVPPGLQVVNRLSSIMASVVGGSEPDDSQASAWRSGTVVRLTGWATMAEVQTKVVRRRIEGKEPEHEDE